jgi:hypothetical protein
MTIHSHDEPRSGPPSRRTSLHLLASLASCAGGSGSSGDHAGQLNGKFEITPATATVVAGQIFHFTASSPWGSGATWTVLPITGGSFDAAGNFTASATPGDYQIVAMWNSDVRYTATASVTVVAAPPPAYINPSVVQAYGNRQVSADGQTHNDAVAGEPIPANSAADGTGAIQVRHGFDPPAVP